MAATALLAFPLIATCLGSAGLLPEVDAGQIKLHLRAATGARMEETAALCDQVEATIREVIPAATSSAWSTTSACRTAASISPTAPPARSARAMPTSWSVSAGGHRPTAQYVRTLRASCPGQFPRYHLRLPAGRHRQPDPELRPSGADRHPDLRPRGRRKPRLCQSPRCGACDSIPGLVDLRIQQAFDYPS